MEYIREHVRSINNINIYQLIFPLISLQTILMFSGNAKPIVSVLISVPARRVATSRKHHTQFMLGKHSPLPLFHHLASVLVQARHRPAHLNAPHQAVAATTDYLQERSPVLLSVSS